MFMALWCYCWASTSLAFTESIWVPRQQGTGPNTTSPGTIQASVIGTRGNTVGKSTATLPPVSQEEPRYDEKIVGGRVARTGEFPWIVSLSWVGGMHFCGGSLLTLKHILTACHCTCRYKDDVDEDLVNLEDVVLSAGSLYTLKSSTGSKVQVRVPKLFRNHPSCRSRRKGGFLFDYSIVVPDRSFKTSPTLEVMKLISLDQGASWKYLVELVKTRRWCKAVGWGTTGISAVGKYVNISDSLKVVGVQLISFAECHELLSNFSALYKEIDVQSRYQVCAKNDNRSDACKGDSGGGFVCGTYVFGLLSWGPSCGEKNTPSMYASIDGGWEFIVKSIVSLTSRLQASFQWLQTTGLVILIINHIRNI